MNGKIIVNRVLARGGRLEVSYKVEGNVGKYFSREAEVFWAEYSEDIEGVPESIAVIPFVGNVLPIVWLADAELVLDELDKTFYECLPEVRHGYMLLSPMLDFLGGELTVGKIVDNGYVPSSQEAVLFSGGVDAFATMLNHIDRKPMLITLWGADVALDDEAGWRVVSEHVNRTAETFSLPQSLFVKTNFRSFVDYWNLLQLVKKSGDEWWHGYQHGLGIISHAAPIAYLHKLERIYIASSFTYELRAICASDPVTDSHVRFAGAEVRHDGYHMNRIEKVRKIVDTCERLGKKIQLRVCWVSRGGRNCCECEKCVRTIFCILAVNGDPGQCGFTLSPDVVRRYRDIVAEELLDKKHIRFSWYEIQNYVRDRKPSTIVGNECYDWILDLDIDRNRPAVARLARKLNKGFRKLKRVTTKY